MPASAAPTAFCPDVTARLCRRKPDELLWRACEAALSYARLVCLSDVTRSWFARASIGLTGLEVSAFAAAAYAPARPAAAAPRLPGVSALSAALPCLSFLASVPIAPTSRARYCLLGPTGSALPSVICSVLATASQRLVAAPVHATVSTPTVVG